MKTREITKPVLFLLFVSLSALVAGCNLPGFEGIPTPGPASTETPAAETEVPITNTPTPTESPTETPQPTPEPTQSAACVAPGGATLPGGSPPFTDYAAVFEEYLSAGGAIDQLRATLEQWGAIVETDAGTFGMVDAEHDLTGDGVNEVIISAVNPEAEPLVFAPPGDLFVYTCVDGAYRLDYSAGGTDPVVDSVPEIVALEDVNGDETLDLIYLISSCGAHTCYANVHGIFWDAPRGGREPLLLFEPPISEPYANVEVHDEDEDGVAELVLNVGTIGSVGAGPQRTWRDVYSWNGTQMVRVEHEPTSTAHPIHLINDADQLMYELEYAEAISLFRRSYGDPGLEREWAPYEGWEQDLEAYARYRIMLAHVALGDEEQAEQVYEGLQTDFPDVDEPGGVFAQWAETFWSEYQATESPEQGCEAVYNSIDVDEFSQNPLNQFGYANRSYMPEDVCRMVDE